MKPFDFGTDGVTGSVDSFGRLIALNFYHPQQGYVTLTSAAPFPEAARYNPAVVRAYRASLATLEGFGVTFDPPPISGSSRLLESAIPEITLRLPENQATVTTFADAQGAVQLISAASHVQTRWRGTFMLQRCAYSQLTEGGPLPMPPLHMRVYPHDDLLVIHNPALGAAVAVAGLDVSSAVEQYVDHPLDLDFSLRAEKLVYGVGTTVEAAIANARWLFAHASLEAALSPWHELWTGLPDDPLLRRGIAYGLLVAVPVGGGICLLTDHMLLPLSWNRDAYFVARALLGAGQRDLVRRHLLWTFETALRPGGAWARCYLANGQVKDSAYQLDQQIYPLLELAEYTLETGDQSLVQRFQTQIEAIFAALDSRRDPHRLLFSTDETPGDDPIAQPYSLSSHILLWHTLDKLNALGLAGSWAEYLTPLRETIQQTFVAERQGWSIYAYAADGTGNVHFYHDANDFPLALAPAWGFVSAADPVWQATIEFAFSEANLGGCYGGRLGSVHTPAPWALGDVQEIVIARALGDLARAERARAHLRTAAQPDGALPEAYNPATGSVVSRRWFAWPSAAYACAELGAFGN